MGPRAKRRIHGLQQLLFKKASNMTKFFQMAHMHFVVAGNESTYSTILTGLLLRLTFINLSCPFWRLPWPVSCHLHL